MPDHKYIQIFFFFFEKHYRIFAFRTMPHLKWIFARDMKQESIFILFHTDFQLFHHHEKSILSPPELYRHRIPIKKQLTMCVRAYRTSYSVPLIYLCILMSSYKAITVAL